ncbi:MAG TPA: hypothetical protein VJC16_04505 [Candidatus Nanoarchaeia archaeon]|nr:hypothetical protein [Candidatus Nanoarchaeia archaeon]
MGGLLELNKAGINSIEEKSGVYQIRCFQNETPRPISRLIKTDNFGILVIGSSNNVKNRLKQFLFAKDNGRMHSAGNRFYSLELESIEKLGNCKLMFIVNYTDDYEKEEAKLLMGYADYFGELPPLNSQEEKSKYQDEDMHEYPKDFDWSNLG